MTQRAKTPTRIALFLAAVGSAPLAAQDPPLLSVELVQVVENEISDPQRVLAADFDADGHADVVVNMPNHSPPHALLMADRVGGFLPAVPFGLQVDAVADLDAGDMDGDGLLDLVASAQAFGAVTVALNTHDVGPAPFGFAPVVNTAHVTAGLALSDLDLDGDLDVCVARVVPGDVLTLLNDGAGQMVAGPAFAGVAAPGALEAADLDGVAPDDVVVASTSAAQVAVMLADGAGGLSAPSTSALAAVPLDLALADLDGDLAMDITCLLENALVESLVGDGAGGFTSSGTAPATVAAGDVRALAAGDLTGDGRPDLLVVDGDGARAALLVNDGAGGWLAPEAAACDGGSTHVDLGDVDGDGRLDGLIAGAGLNSVAVLRADDSGGLVTPTSVDTGVSDLRVFEAVDMDLDGSADAVALFGPGSAPQLLVALGDGAGTLTPMAPVALASQTGALAMAVADVDGDAYPDVLVSGALGTTTLLRGAGDGSVLPATPLAGVARKGPTLADVDADGDLDLVGLHGSVVRTAFNTGAGDFPATADWSSGVDLPLRAGDLDHDGLADITFWRTVPVPVTAGRSAIGDGAGGFVELAYHGPVLLAEPADVALGDVDGDGFLDGLTLVEHQRLYTALNQQDGSLHSSAFAQVELPRDVVDLEVADIDGDGLDDALVGLQGHVFAQPFGAIALSKGQGTFREPRFHALAGPHVGLGDTTGDGRLDVLAMDDAGALTLQPNVSAPSPWEFLGGALPGLDTVPPAFVGSGPLWPGSPYTLALSGARADSTAALVVGLTEVALAFKGGVLVPSPDLVVAGLPTGPVGALALTGEWPLGAPSGSSLVLQWWITDAAGPVGFSATNGLRGTTP